MQSSKEKGYSPFLNRQLSPKPRRLESMDQQLARNDKQSSDDIFKDDEESAVARKTSLIPNNLSTSDVVCG